MHQQFLDKGYDRIVLDDIYLWKTANICPAILETMEKDKKRQLAYAILVAIATNAVL